MEAHNMVPDEECVSAFAVYSGIVSKNKKKKKIKTKQKKVLDNSLNKSDKISIILQKKIKKEKALDSLKAKESKLPIESKQSLGETFTLKSKKKVLKANIPTPLATKTDGKKKKKKKKIVPTQRQDIINNGKAEDEMVSGVGSGILGSNLGTEKNARDQDNRKGSKEELVIGDKLSSIKSQYNGGPSGLKPKKVKKLRIVDPEFPSRSGGFKKPVVSTPRVSKKAAMSSKIPTKTPVQSSSNVLKNVDSFLSQTYKVSSGLSADESGSPDKDQAYVQLMEQARSDMLSKGSTEGCGRLALETILQPYSVDDFLQSIWERKPLHIIGKRANKFTAFISTEVIDAVLRDNVLYFGKHLDVTVYADGKRETHNLEGRAHAHVIWDYYANGCSVRLLNPQYFINNVHTLNAALQEFFGCFVGANVYLTPPNSQGFAPHYDDIEAFILQVEGSKIWRIYPPISKDGYLPRYSSRNLNQDEIGEPMMEVKVSAGDVLYFPRGFIHQGRTESEHSLHITLSVYQKTAWCDLLEKLLPLTLKKAASQDVEFRRGLPLGYLKSGGLAYKDSDMRKQVVTTIKKLVNKLNDFLETDAALDQMGLSYIKDALPPVLNSNEAARSVVGGGWRMKKNGNLTNQTEFSTHCSIRWIRSYCFRVVEEDVTLEDGTIERQTRVYHNLDNSREYHKEEPQYIILPQSMAPAAIHLAQVYPKFTKVSDLPGLDDDEKLTFVGDLWDRGLIMTEKPLKVIAEAEPESEETVILTKEEMEVVADLEDAIPTNESDSDSNSGDESTEMGTFLNDFIEFGDPFASDEDPNVSGSDNEPTLLNH